jgi:hypothetical protein
MVKEKKLEIGNWKLGDRRKKMGKNRNWKLEIGNLAFMSLYCL